MGSPTAEEQTKVEHRRLWMSSIEVEKHEHVLRTAEEGSRQTPYSIDADGCGLKQAEGRDDATSGECVACDS